MSVEDIASQRGVVSVYNMTEETQFLGFKFPQVVQRHYLEEVEEQITISYHILSATCLPKITKNG